AARHIEPQVNVFGNGVVCDTDSRGYPTPQDRDPADLVVDASEGFIPLWARDVTLRWRFQQRSLSVFVNPDAAAAAIRELFGEALLAWGDAAPVKFAQRDDAWDFEIVVKGIDDCSPNGCVLASAFFPDAGRHELIIYPKMFTQAREEMVETLIHEIGHTFGLRHFFANVSEEAWPSQIFGTHEAFSIMNYGSKSVLTETDKADLKALYQLAWGGGLTQINGTPIRFVRPFSALAPQPEVVFALQRSSIS
ncbi:matrixin family metalloprotease, partial [Actinoplanes sp. NPDC051633]|uniref:matrixin family metalloprotease n=1 Tax=Actinoplanes sp. NPDC051633 TaxID=3155670 RepID=UPI003447A89C